MNRALIVSTILRHLTDDYFADKADRISFGRVGAADRVEVPYPR